MPLNSPILSGDISGGLHSTSVDKIKGSVVSGTAPVTGQTLVWDGSQWAPATTQGGGGGANGLTYYLRQDVDADAPTTNLPGTPKQLGRSGATGATSITSGTLTTGVWTLLGGYVSEAVPIDPNITAIPGGIWDFNLWAYGTANANAGTVIRALVYVYNGADAPTLIATSGEQVINNVSAQFSLSVLVPQTTVTLTDRIYVAVEVKASASNHTATLQFGDGQPSHVHTSLPLVGGTGLWKNVAGVLQSPASLLVNADVDSAAAIAQSKIANLTTDLGNKAGTAQVDVYATTGTFTWTKPAGAKTVTAYVIAGGGGGGSGRASASWTAAGGGGGGGGSARTFVIIDAAFLGATETVTVGSGGLGAIARAVGQDGLAGGNGNPSSFGLWASASQGGGGGAGTATGGGSAGAQGSRGLFAGAAGGLGSATFGIGGNGNASSSCPSGGAGGGVTAGSPGVASSGGTGGFQFLYNGSAQSATPANTSGVSVPVNLPYGGAGGGGGSASASAAASAGGNAGNYGAGGGGGGAGQGFNSGAGGNGGQGIVVVITHF